jgi:putative ABC transport system permease protein
MRLKSGRLLRHTDHAGAPGAAVISDAAAARLAARDPVGGKVWFEFGGREFSGAIVGVVHGSRSMDLMTQPEPEVYVPYEQHPVMDTMFLAARAKERRAAALPLRAVVGRVAPRAVVEDVQEFRTLVHRSAAASRLNMVLVGTLAGAALLLAAIGLYAIVADHVAMRGREMGIRLALGARAASVLRLVLRDALQTALAGIAVGILAAYVLTVVLRAWLFGVGPHDPLTFAGVSALLLVVSLVATYLPARRAARVDPVIALREDG